MEQELEYIYEIHKAGSFSKAAESLHVTQPALSMAVKRIEASIGMTLFDRTARPLGLTEAGRIYIDSIREILAVEENLNNRIRDIDELKSGHLCIGGSHFINAYILPETMTRYSAKYPGISLELVEASSAELAGMLSERLIDLTLTCRSDIIAGFEHYPSFSDHIILAVSPEILNLPCALSANDILNGRHLSEDCPSIPEEAMRELEYIILSEGNNLHDRAYSIFNDMGIVEPKIKIEISQLATSYYLARSKFGAAFVSDRMIKSDEKNLNFYRIASSITDRLFYAVLPRREYTPKAVRAFIETLKLI